MKTLVKWMLLCLTFLFMVACEDDAPVETSCADTVNELQMNQYQVVGSHNSYRMVLPPAIMALLEASADLLPEGFDPRAWDYDHVPLLEQLNTYGVRSIELDVFRDPVGGLFYNRMGNALIGSDISSEEPALLESGLKVLHFPDFDYMTHYLTFKDALADIKTWSDNNPNHIPLTVLVEAKEDNPDLMLPDFGLTSTLPFVDGSVQEIEDEILDVFANDTGHILTPDDVRGVYPTLKEAVQNKAWPRLESIRGKILFVLMAREEVADDYGIGHPSLSNRMMFVFRGNTDYDDAAFLKIDEPIENYTAIQEYVQEGFMVRTHADANTLEARFGSYDRMNAAFNSGAQIISTDYYRADPRAATSEEWSDYTVTLPTSGIAQVNELTTPFLDVNCEITE